MEVHFKLPRKDGIVKASGGVVGPVLETNDLLLLEHVPRYQAQAFADVGFWGQTVFCPKLLGKPHSMETRILRLEMIEELQ